MLSFIPVLALMLPIFSNSNTSHVIIYRRNWKGYDRNSEIQIHPMLSFIAPVKKWGSCSSVFKYIPCYHLSVMLISLSPNISNSNTSHVIIYRKWNRRHRPVHAIQIHPMLSFISSLHSVSSSSMYSNTSHVIIYPYYACDFETTV